MICYPTNTSQRARFPSHTRSLTASRPQPEILGRERTAEDNEEYYHIHHPGDCPVVLLVQAQEAPDARSPARARLLRTRCVQSRWQAASGPLKLPVRSVVGVRIPTRLTARQPSCSRRVGANSKRENKNSGSPLQRPVKTPSRSSRVRSYVLRRDYLIDPATRRTAVTTAAHEFSPTCAVLGGLLAQDVLKALGRRDAPTDNFFVFDGVTGQGSVLCMRTA